MAPLDDSVQHLGAGGLGQGGELEQGVLGVLGGALGPDASEHHALQAQLAVLDLGDVLEFGGESSHAAQGLAFGQVVLVTVVVGGVSVSALGQGQRAAGEQSLALVGLRLTGVGAV